MRRYILCKKTVFLTSGDVFRKHLGIQRRVIIHDILLACHDAVQKKDQSWIQVIKKTLSPDHSGNSGQVRLIKTSGYYSVQPQSTSSFSNFLP